MKKIVLKHNCIRQGSEDYIADYLLSVGIKPEDINAFKYAPTDNYEDDPFLLDNINEGLETVKTLMDKGVKTFIQVDSDVDGFTSAAIFINYFKSLYPNNSFSWRLHKGKEHGIILDTVPQDCELIIIPDAGSIQFEEQKKLVEQGKTVIILDHHHIENDYERIEGVTIINNQLGTFPNKDLCGAAVVYMFIKAFSQKFSKIDYKEYIDLAAFGLISDMMDTRAVGNHYIIYHGLMNIKNKMFKALIEKQAFSINKISKVELPSKYAIAYYITPLVNGLIRSGEQEEKELCFRGFIENTDETFEHTFRGKTTYETLYARAARLASNAKSRQDSGKKKSLEFLDTKIDNEDLMSNQLLVICLDDAESKKVDSNITGLAAMAVLNKYNKPCLVLRRRIDETTGKEMYCGSGRSKDFFGFRNFMQFISDSGLSCYTAGHPNAFGCWIEADKLDQFINYCNEKLADCDFEDCYEVDYYFHYYIDMNMLMTFARYDCLFGQGMAKPMFAFDLEVDTNNITIMKEEHLKIMQNGVTFIKFGCKDLIEQLQRKEINNVTIVGQPSLNEYNGRTNVQIMIDDIFISDKQASSLAQLI